jgi:hypothetical protein
VSREGEKGERRVGARRRKRRGSRSGVLGRTAKKKCTFTIKSSEIKKFPKFMSQCAMSCE